MPAGLLALVAPRPRDLGPEERWLLTRHQSYLSRNGKRIREEMEMESDGHSSIPSPLFVSVHER